MSQFTSNIFRTALGCAVVFFGALPSFAQTNPASTVESKTQSPAARDAENTKKWSVYWGWNRSNYSNSDIRFWGEGHDVTFSNVQASDRQTEVNADNLFGTYFNPSLFTIPQYNLRVAYQLNDDTAVALNLDHMKYVMNQDQTVQVNGTISNLTQSGTKKLTEDYLTFEHTDGLNIVSIEVEKQKRIDIFGPSLPTRIFVFAGLGIVIPKSNVGLGFMNRARNDEWHLAGYSVAAGTGIEMDLYKDFFFRTAYRLGYVNLPDVLTSSQGDKASHHFTYNEILIAAGMRF